MVRERKKAVVVRDIGRLWSSEISFGLAEEEGCGDERYHLVRERKKTAVTLHLVRSSRRLLISE